MDSIATLKSVDVARPAAVQSREVPIQEVMNTSTDGPSPRSEGGKGVPVKATDNNGSSNNSSDAVKQLKESVDAANARLAAIKQRVDLSVDRDTGQVVVKVSNTSTGEVISQVPSENALKLAKSLDSLTGILVDKKG